MIWRWRSCSLTALATGCLLLVTSLGPVSIATAQTSNFANTTKTVTLPKGAKVDPRYLLRRKAPAKDPDAKKPLTEEEQAAEDAKKLADNLDGKLLGAWTRVSSVTDDLSAPAIQAAARRCFQQLTLKPLKFQTGAAEQLPDIDALFGDIVYYRTEKGLQRLDITTGLIRLVSEIAVNQLKNAQLVWTLTGERLRLRIRFSKPLPQAPKARFMIEECGFYLRCPLNKEELFNVDQ